jgi:hypothetical protein
MFSSPRAHRATTLSAGAALIVLATAVPSLAASTLEGTVSTLVSGSSVTGTTTLSASPGVKASLAGVCARDDAGGLADFPFASNIRISSGSTITRTKTFRPGTYTYWSCAQVSGTWRRLSEVKTFAIAVPASPTPIPPPPPTEPVAVTLIDGNRLPLNAQSITTDTSSWTTFDSRLTLDATGDASKVIDGNQAVRAVVSTAGDVRAHLRTRAGGILPGTAYRISSWVRPGQSERTGSVSVAWYDAVGAWLSAPSRTASLGTAGTATKLELSVVAPVGAASALVSVGMNGASVQDDFTFDRTYLGTASDPLGAATAATTPTPASTLPTATTLPPSTGAPNGWTRVLAEDFSTDVAAPGFPVAYPAIGSYPDSWTNSVRSSWYGGGKTVAVSGGVARARVSTDAAGRPRTETLVPRATQNQLYGRYLVRWRIPAALPGYKVAWLLWPNSEVWPRDGEIDFPEGNLAAGRNIEGYVHHQGATSGSDQAAFASQVSTTGSSWHTTEIIWAPGLCQFVLDGTVIGTTTSRVPNTSMGWRIQTEGNLESQPISTTTAGDVEIDWIAAYRLS